MAEAQSKGLAALRRRLAALDGLGKPGRGVLPFGLAAIDQALPDNGLALGALHEAAGAGGDEEDGAVAAAFLAGILARLEPLRPVLWCLAEDDLYAPGLAAAGLAGGRLILARTRRAQDLLWAMEEGLKCPGLAAVVGEVAALALAESRRLQLAAEASGVTGFVLRRWRTGEDATRQRLAPNAALTRWRVKALPGDIGDGAPGVGRARWQVELWRCRGGEAPKSWMVEACDATGHVALAAALADRPAARAPARARG